MEREVVILDIDYISYEDKPVIRLFSKDGDKNVVLIDDSFTPYLYVYSKSPDECIDDINELLDDVIVEKVTRKDFQIEKTFIKVTFTHPQEVSKNRDAIRDLDSVIQIREYDIPFYRRYLMNRDIIPMTKVKASGELIDSFSTLDSKKHGVEIIKLDKPLERIEDNLIDFRILSFDLEVRNPHGMPDSAEDEIIMIGVASNFGINQVISTKTNSENNG